MKKIAITGLMNLDIKDVLIFHKQNARLILFINTDQEFWTLVLKQSEDHFNQELFDSPFS